MQREKKASRKTLEEMVTIKKPTIQQPRGGTQPNTHLKIWGHPSILNPFLEPVMHHLTY